LVRPVRRRGLFRERTAGHRLNYVQVATWFEVARSGNTSTSVCLWPATNRIEIRLPRYFFDIHDGRSSRDDEGTECADLEAARGKILATLPDLSGLITEDGGDDQAVTILVRAEDSSGVYKATLTFTGRRLNQAGSS
jgi:hypothetical protein